jgi:hydroxymethylbilane synthase
MEQTITDIEASRLAAMLTDRKVRIGTRRSPMALAQANNVMGLLLAAVPDLAVELVEVETSGDLWHGDLAALGGKGAFTKEIDRMLMRGEIDAAVHCAKDVPGDKPLPPGTMFAAWLERDDVHDVVVMRAGDTRTLEELPAGTLIGTSAVRRRAQLSLQRPDLAHERVRGNVNTRIERLDASDRHAALILAGSGLHRVGLEDRISQVLPLDWEDGGKIGMYPPIGAGAVGVQVRTDDAELVELVGHLNHGPTMAAITAERAALHALMGHCNSPIAGHCTRGPDGLYSLRLMVFSRDGSTWLHTHKWHKDPGTLGFAAAADLLERGARNVIDAIPH